MKNNTLLRTIILGFTLLICLMTNMLMAIENPTQTNNEVLSVRESLLPMFSFAFRMNNEFFPVHRINPEVRPYILFYLENDNNIHDHVAGGIWLLGVVGTKEDIEFVDNYIQSHLNNSNEDNKRLIYFDDIAGAIGCFAGMTLKRDIDGAEKFCQKYTDVSAWISSKAIDDVNARRAYNYFILGAYQYSKADFILPFLRQTSFGTRPFLRESVIDTLEHLETDYYTEMMQPCAKPEEELKKIRTNFLSKNGEWIDMLMNKQTLAEWRKAQEKQKAVPSLMIEGTKIASETEAKRVAFDSYFKKMQLNASATESVQEITIIKLGFDIADFAIKGEKLWETRIKTLEGALRAIIWINPNTEKIHFVIGPWKKSDDKKQIQMELTSKLAEAKTLEQLDKVVEEAYLERSKHISDLSRMLHSNINGDLKARVCFLLGEFRAERAMGDLGSIMTFEHSDIEDGAMEITELPRWFKYPAAEALAKCGFRSIPIMVKKLETSDDEKFR